MSEELPEQVSAAAVPATQQVKQEIWVTEYVNAAAASSSRARNVIIVLIVSTVLMAVEIRNTSESWIDERIAVRTAALKLVETDAIPDKRDSLIATDPDLYRRANLFLQRRKLDPKSAVDKKLLEEELEDYREVAVEHVSFFRIPFFGAIFDHNDLGMFGGFAFAVILIWLRYSLARELSNLNLIFNTIRGKNRRRCYELLAMQQVFTVPRLKYSSVRHRWRWVPRALYFIPLPLFLVYFYYDFTSIFSVGEVLGTGKMWVLVITSLLFFALMLIFSFSCFRILRGIDEVWDKAAASVYPKLFGPQKSS